MGLATVDFSRGQVMVCGRWPLPRKEVGQELFGFVAAYWYYQPETGRSFCGSDVDFLSIPRAVGWDSVKPGGGQ